MIDKNLMIHGDSRNVIDKYRNWTVESIKDDLSKHSFDYEIAIENSSRDYNMGTIVRNANAFGARKVHIIGSRQWNKRGAMMTDKYLDVVYHKNTAAFLTSVKDVKIIAIDNVSGSHDLSKSRLPINAVYVFGSESSGLSDELKLAADEIIQIEQFGSTRSINVGVASGVIMYEWVCRNVLK